MSEEVEKEPSTEELYKMTDNMIIKVLCRKVMFLESAMDGMMSLLRFKELITDKDIEDYAKVICEMQDDRMKDSEESEGCKDDE